MVRLYQMDPASFKPPKDGVIQPILTLEGHYEGVNCVDISECGSLLVSSSSDCTCFVFSIKNPATRGQRLHKLTFADLLADPRNMMMRGCFFIGSEIYTMAT
jgi:WD40 repeat protein